MFDALLGQARLKETVAQMLAHDRMPHALLLRGPDGVGKLRFALHLAAYLNSDRTENTDTPGWRQVMKLEHPELLVIPPLFAKTIDGKKLTSEDFAADFRQFAIQHPYALLDAWGEHLYDSSTFKAKSEGGKNKQFNIPIDEVRQLQRRLQLRPQPGAWRVVILWHVEKMNVSAANAFLKLLEEPPDRTLLVLTAGEGETLLPTITSRCQSLLFERVAPQLLQQWLMQEHQVPAALAEELALVADGSPGRALDMAQSTQNPFRTQFIDWMRMCYEGNEKKIADFADEIRGQSLEYQKRFLEFSLQKLRDALTHIAGVPQLALSTQEENAFLAKFSQFMGMDSIAHMESLIEKSLRQVQGNAFSPLVFAVLSQQVHLAMRDGA